MEGMTVIYIKPDEYTQIPPEKNKKGKMPVKIKDVAQVFCSDPRIKTQTEQIVFMKMDVNSHKKYAVSVMTLVECIENAIKVPVLVQNIGESDFLLSLTEKKQKRWYVGLKIGLILLITFFGSMFAIMAYNEDVDVSGVFDKIYSTMYGKTRKTPGIMEIAYAVGVALGVIVFFNHFGKKKINSDPTPMEVEMEKYEEDIDNTLIKEITRRQNGS